MTFDIFKRQEADEKLAEMTQQAQSFLPSLSLQYGVSTAVTEGKAHVRDYVLGDLNLGKEVVVVFGPYRPRAEVWNDGELVEGPFYDDETEEYQTIHKAAKRFAKGAKAGPEFLIWVPEAQKFAVLHFARTNLGQAGEVRTFGAKPVILTSKVIKGKNNTYPVYKLNPFDGDEKALALPSKEAAAEAEELFTAPLRTAQPVNER